MPAINTLTLGGHLTRDAEIKYTTNGKPWTMFTVAVTEKYKQGDEWKSTTAFIGCKWWGCYENAGEWLRKGRAVFVTGKLSENAFKRQDGTEVKTLECKVEHCYPVENTRPERTDRPEPVSRPRTHKYEPPQRQAAAQVNQHGVEIDDESIPF